MVKRFNKKYPGVLAGMAFILLLPGIFMQGGCRIGPSSGEKTKAFLLIVNYPMVLSVNKDSGTPARLYNLLDTLTVYSFSGYKIYKLPGVRAFETDKPIPGSEPFFVFKAGQKFGMYFKTLRDTNYPRKLPVDSLLIREGFQGTQFTRDPTLMLVDSFMDERGHLIEQYAAPKSKNPISADSIYFYFSKSYTEIDHSLSKSLDSLRKMKLYKVRLLFNQKIVDSVNITMPKREIFFELQPVEVRNFDQMAMLIKKIESR